MIAFSRSVPDNWNEHDRLAKTTAGGMGIHAAILDIDIGPLLQVQKLINSVRFARAKGYTAPLSAAELELMNLTGDGNGIDMVTMPQSLARASADREFLPAVGLRAQSGGAAHRARSQGSSADMESKMARGIAIARRQGSGGGVLERMQR